MTLSQGLAMAIDGRASFIYDKHGASLDPAMYREGDE
jgi:hypothetical protein